MFLFIFFVLILKTKKYPHVRIARENRGKGTTFFLIDQIFYL